MGIEDFYKTSVYIPMTPEEEREFDLGVEEAKKRLLSILNESEEEKESRLAEVLKTLEKYNTRMERKLRERKSIDLFLIYHMRFTI